MLREVRTFGKLSDGRDVLEYTLSNGDGLTVSILNYGGIIRTLHTPDRSGKLDDIVLGFDNLVQYEGDHPYLGAIIGRIAGRVGRGRLPIDGVDYQLTTNHSLDHIHGGEVGFDRKLWDAAFIDEDESLILACESADGEEGYPGRLHSFVSYNLTDANELIVHYRTTADAPSVANLTQHSYFNLSGDLGKEIFGHSLKISSNCVLELDDSAIPTGRVLSVENTRFDFHNAKIICEEEGHYDNFWVVAGELDVRNMRLAAELRDLGSGRAMQVLTDAPGVQVYTGGNLPERLIGKSDVSYRPGVGICFETQAHPDSVNHAEFPDIRLRANETSESTTVFRFSVL